LVKNLILGGLNGYVSGILISRWNIPPSYGVSGGPVAITKNMNDEPIECQVKKDN